MVIDNLQNLERYAVLHPLFAQVFEYLKTIDLHTCPLGKTVLKEGEISITVTEAPPKRKEEACLETHNKFIDIQIPVSGEETMGYASRNMLPEACYDAEKDITFYEVPVESYVKLAPGMFAVFFPEDAHAPAITSTTLRKAIIKIKSNL